MEKHVVRNFLQVINLVFIQFRLHRLPLKHHKIFLLFFLFLSANSVRKYGWLHEKVFQCLKNYIAIVISRRLQVAGYWNIDINSVVKITNEPKHYCHWNICGALVIYFGCKHRVSNEQMII